MAALARLRAVAANRRIVALTAWDFPTGLLAENGGMDLVLVGDSLGVASLGHADTTEVTLDEMVSRTGAVTRAFKRGFVMADLPLGSYEKSAEHAIESALRLIKEGRANGVKLEGGQEMGLTIRAITTAGVAVIGHIGMTPQRCINADFEETSDENSDSVVSMAKNTLNDALAVQDAGAVAVVLESVPSQIAKYITSKLRIPTIGLGSGPSCSGQIVLQSEALGYQSRLFPQWHKQYANIGEQSVKALLQYSTEVIDGSFPATEQSADVSKETLARLEGVWSQEHS